MFSDHRHTVNRSLLDRTLGKKSGSVGNIFGTRGLRLGYAALILVPFLLSTNLRAQLVQTLSVQDLFGVSHPDQILEFNLSNSINPAVSYVIGPGGTEVPYQLLRGNKLAIRSDLPANTQRSWQVMNGRAPASFSGGVQLTETADYYEIINGLTGVRVVKPTAPQALTLAPVQGLRLRDGRWTATGPNKLYQPSYAAHSTALLTAAKAMTVSVLENGPLKVVIQVSNAYDRPFWQAGGFTIPAGPGFYLSTIELQAGQPSILIEDDTDMEFRYSLNVYDLVQPTQGRYRSHHSDSTAYGYEADGRQYRQEHDRPIMDAFRDFSYSGAIYDSFTTSAVAIQRMSSWNRWAYNTGRQYWMIYNRDAAGLAVVGAFPARASRAIGSHASGPGPYFLPDDGTGRRAAGFSFQAIHRGADNSFYPRHRFSWGIFIGVKPADVGDPYQVQNIGRQHNLHGGFSLDKLKEYYLTYPDPAQGYGRMFMDPAILRGMITRLRSGDITYRNYLNTAEPYAKPLVDMWADPSGISTRNAAAGVSLLASNMLNTYINGNGIHDVNFGYWQGALNMTGKALVIDSILADPLASANDKIKMKAVAAMFGGMLFDGDFVPVDNYAENPINLGTANMPVQWAGARNLFVLFIATHPLMLPKVPTIASGTIAEFRNVVNDWGAQIGSTHYTAASVTPPINALLQTRMAGQIDPFAVEPRLSKFAEFYMNFLTPPEVRFGAPRKIIANSDGSTEGENTFLFGELATGFRAANPALSSRLMGAWNSAGKVHSGFWASTILMIDESAPAQDPKLGDGNFPGYMSVLRHGWGTPNETVAWLFNGNFYSDHRHNTAGGYADQGAVVLYALGAPISINWGSFYSPQVPGGAFKSTVVPENLFANWQQSNLPLGSGAGWPASSSDFFASFAASSRANARVRNGDGSLSWIRVTTSIHPTENLPVVVITDTFEGAGNAVPKIFTLNMMAEGAVVTPSGSLTPAVVTSPTLPSVTGPFTLNSGLNRLAFTGQTWNAHPTRGVDWDLYTLSSETLSGVIGHWGHSWHPNRELVQFQAANGRSFQERQHILRLKGTGTFRTFILPFRKGQKPTDLQVRQNGSTVDITTAGQITTIHDNWYAYTNSQKRVLTTFTSAQAQAFGLSASGGPTEVILEANRALVTAHGARGPRTVKIPASWKPVVSGAVPTQEFGTWVVNHNADDPFTVILE